MKGFYDKIILTVGVLALAGSGAYYATAMKVEAGGAQAQSPVGADFASLEAKQTTAEFSDWSDPEAQDPEGRELYDVFTPPKIWWNAEEEVFIFEPPGDPLPARPSFGLALLEVSQELYRIQLEAYFESLDGKDENASIQLYDEKTDTSFRGKVGAKFPEHNAEIVDFKVEKVINPESGTIRRVPKVTILDSESGEQITLTTEERLYIPNSYTLNLETRNPYPSQRFSWETVGETKSVADVTFKLLEFDFDNQTAKVEKTFTDDTYTPETKTLSASSNESAVTTTETIVEENAVEEEIPTEIDSFFPN